MALIYVLAALGVGMTLGFLGYDGVKESFGDEVTNALYTYHKTFGVMILALMILRLALRLGDSRALGDRHHISRRL